MSTIAIITARGGSKRIPKKNIKEFMGKPMLAYAINAAKDSKLFDEIMVSTDSNDIAAVAKEFGANVPFMRSNDTSGDFVSTDDVILEVIDEYKKLGRVFDDICCIYPCVPFLTGEILKNAYNVFKNIKANALIPVVKYSFPIQRAFLVNDKGLIQYREPEHAYTRSQDLAPMYHDVGMFYFYRKIDVNEKEFAFYEMDETQIQDIDNISDWKMAEMKYKILKGIN